MNKVSQNDDNLKEQTNISRKNIIICNYNDRIIYIMRNTKSVESVSP